MHDGNLLAIGAHKLITHWYDDMPLKYGASKWKHVCCAEDLSAPNNFWKGTAAALLHPNTFNCQPATPMTRPEPLACTGWATAAQRLSQNPQGDVTRDSSLLSEYKPAEQVLAAAPKVADDCKVLVKRPPRPKVEVSDNLRALLQVSGQQQASEVDAPGFTPCKQVAGTPSKQVAGTPSKHWTTSKSPGGQVVLKKGPQYRPAALPLLSPVQTAQGTEQAGQQQDDGSAALGSKRPAAQPAALLVPALLKRPKLSNHSKQPALKAAAAQSRLATNKGPAAGKPAAAKKAPASLKAAGSKAATKTSSAKAEPKAISLLENGSVAALNLQTAAPVGLGTGSSIIPGAAALVPLEAAGAMPAALQDATELTAVAAAAVAPAKAPRQRKKADDIDLAEVEKKIQEKFGAGRLQDLSIPELKCFLKARKLPVGGKKSDLVARIEPLLGKG